PPALHDLRAAVDVDDALQELGLGGVGAAASHLGSHLSLLEFQAGGAGAAGERLDAPVIEIAAAVERDLGHALFLRALGEQLADRIADGGLALPVDARLHVVAATGLGQR